MNRILRISDKRLKALEQKKSKKAETLFINLIDRDVSLFYQIKTKLPKGWRK